jgi:hypothetical protein
MYALQRALRRSVGRLQGLNQGGAASIATTSGATPQGQGPKTPPEEEGAERQIKPGVNSPDTLGKAVQETLGAASSLAERVSTSFKAAASAIGLSSDKHSNLSQDEIHGAAGKMQHAPPGSVSGGAAADRPHANAKYAEISGTEKPHFPKGEQSVNELFPDMAEAAKLQNKGARTNGDNDGELQKNLHEKGP